MPDLNARPSRSPLSLFLLSVVCAGGLAVSSAAFTDDHEETPLGHAMEGIQGNMRNLRSVVGDVEQKGRALELLHTTQGHALEALAHEPTLAADKEGDEKALFVVGFRRELVQLLDSLYSIEQAVIQGKVEDAQAGFQELLAIKKSGHDTYQ